MRELARKPPQDGMISGLPPSLVKAIRMGVRVGEPDSAPRFSTTATSSSDTAPEADLQRPHWCLHELSGRLTELSARGDSASLTLTFSIVLDAQRQGETVAWVADSKSIFFPLDVAATGVDLEALAVIRVPGKYAIARNIARVADRLARSGAFGLIILDLGEDFRVPTALQSRLRGLAYKHDTAILCLTQKSGAMASIGSMVSLRGEARRHRNRRDAGRFTCELEVLKDKHRGPGWTHTETCIGLDGLY